MLEKNGRYPFHIPGHKRNASFGICGSDIDITEIDGFDNLHNPTGVLRELEERCAEAFGYAKSIISVNGSTCCVLSAISALCNRGDSIIIARNCHKSVYNACLINELRVTYIEPEFIDELGTYGRITQEALDAAIEAVPEAKSVVITSPTYEGVVSDVKCDIPLIIDAAHGSHFGFADFLPKRPQADIVINSLHKTLPSPTQTAVIHINNPEYFDGIKKYMDIYETSSPSYILLAGVEKCIDFLADCKGAFNEYKKLLDRFFGEVQNIPSLHIFGSDDVSRIIIYSDAVPAQKLAENIRRAGVEPEAVSQNYITLISTVCDTDEGFERLLNGLKDDSSGNPERYVVKPALPEKACEAYEVTETKPVKMTEAEGKICGQYIYAYPPGIPLIVPGEIIDKKLIEAINDMKIAGVNLIFEGGFDDNMILTKI